ELIAKPEPGWRGDAGGPIGGTQAFLADDQIYAVGEHHILALDQEKQKSGYGWFAGTQMTLAGDMGYMANGTKIIAVDRTKHAEGTRIRHGHEVAISKLGTDLKKHPAVAAAKKLQAAESAARKVKDDPAAFATAQAELAAIAEKYEPLRIAYKAKQDEVAKHKADLAALKDAGVKWSLDTPHQSALIIAGKTVIAGGQGEVIAIEAETGRQVWKAAVDGEARGLAVSEGHLVVSTTTGRVYVFGEKAADVIAAKKTNDFPSDKAHAEAAEAILKQTGITKGFCIVLGNDKGQLAYELAKRSELVIFGVDADEKKVAASRQQLLATGLYGTRITVDHLDLAVMPFSSYCANLIVSDSSEPLGSAADVAQHLKPIGGKFCFKATPATAAWFAETKLTEAKATIANLDGWSVLTRSSLPGASSWSHQYGNAANTSSTDDRRIKGGLSVLWYGDPGPGKVVNRHDGAVGPLSVNGRLFVQGEDSVMAYDAYNGQMLWETRNPGAMRIGVYNAREPGNMAASDDYLFMLIEDECIQFDAATGKIVRTLKIPGAGTRKDLQWGYIAYQDGLLYGTETERVEKAAEVARRGKSGSISTDRIFAFDVKTGTLKWTHQGKHISHVSIAIGDGRLFFIDASLTPEQRALMLAQDKTDLAKLTGKERELAEDRVKNNDLRMAVALDAITGKQQWATGGERGERDERLVRQDGGDRRRGERSQSGTLQRRHGGGLGLQRRWRIGQQRHQLAEQSACGGVHGRTGQWRAFQPGDKLAECLPLAGSGGHASPPPSDEHQSCQRPHRRRHHCHDHWHQFHRNHRRDLQWGGCNGGDGVRHQHHMHFTCRLCRPDQRRSYCFRWIRHSGQQFPVYLCGSTDCHQYLTDRRSAHGWHDCGHHGNQSDGSLCCEIWRDECDRLHGQLRHPDHGHISCGNGDGGHHGHHGGGHQRDFGGGSIHVCGSADCHQYLTECWSDNGWD
ncbi:MAG: hypothetical protein B7Z55_03540, partial [Planctomycetales bacterium 12-60-4]